MKKLLILASLIAAVGTYAQGTIAFQNRATAVGLDVFFTLDDQTPANTFGDGKLGANYNAGLYLKQGDGSFAPAVLLASGAPATVSFITSATAGPTGYFSVANLGVQGTDLNGTVEVKVVAWPKGQGTSYQAAVDAMAAQGIVWSGMTPSFSVSLGGGGSPVKVPGAMTGLEGVATDANKTFFQVTASVIPEPSIFALGLLGGAALLLRRRS